MKRVLMGYRFSFAADENSQLHHITYVDGDREYDYRVRRFTDSTLVAVRTLAGAGALDIDGAGLRIISADSLLITELSRIRYYGTYNQSWQFYWFNFLRECGAGVPWDEVIPVSPTVWEIPVTEHIFSQLPLPDLYAQTSAVALFKALLCHWTAVDAAKDRRSNSASELVRRALEQFNAPDQEFVSIEALAADLGIGARLLRQAFVQELGCCPKRHFTTLRMRQASQALMMGRGAVARIAEQLGYASPFHFSRAFKAEFGCCPTQYIENLRQKSRS